MSESDKRIESMAKSTPIIHNKDFYYRGRGSWEMTHEELVQACLELNELWRQTQADYLHALDML